MGVYKDINIECREGWKYLYQPLIDLCLLHHIKVQQVKEKFGRLCFYFFPYQAETGIPTLVTAAEAASGHICEFCGDHSIIGRDEKGKGLYRATTGGKGWIKTLCPPCRETFDKR